MTENTIKWIKNHPFIAGFTQVGGTVGGFLGSRFVLTQIGFEIPWYWNLGIGVLTGATLVIIEGALYALFPSWEDLKGGLKHAASLGFFGAVGFFYTALADPTAFGKAWAPYAVPFSEAIAPVTTTIADGYDKALDTLGISSSGDTYTPKGGKEHKIDTPAEKAAFDDLMKACMTPGASKDDVDVKRAALEAAINSAHAPSKSEDGPTPPKPKQYSDAQNTLFIANHMLVNGQDTDAERSAYAAYMKDPKDKAKQQAYRDSILQSHGRI